MNIIPKKITNLFLTPIIFINFRFHLEKGLLEAATQWAEKQQIVQSQNQENSSFNLMFGTGVTYVNYLWTKSLHFVVHEDLASVQKLHNHLFHRNSQTLFFTSLKILSGSVATRLSPEPRTEELSANDTLQSGKLKQDRVTGAIRK